MFIIFLIFIKANVSDEGSAYVRLFKQVVISPSNEDSDYEEEEELDDTIIEHDSNLSVPYESDGEEEDDPNKRLKTIEQEFSEYQENNNRDRAYLNEIVFQNKIEIANKTKTQNEFTENFNDTDEYSFKSRDSEPLKCFKINLGTAECPRFSCACHKCNIAVRMAIKKCPSLTRVLAKLSKYAGAVKNSINLYKLHISKKARLRIENDTRWASSFLLLEAFQRAYIRNAFPAEKPCPVPLKTIEMYMQILMPAFKFSLLMQRTTSTIADVVPNVLMMLSKWNRMEVGGNCSLLCDSLTNAFKHKFNYELNSPVYAVASLFNIKRVGNTKRL